MEESQNTGELEREWMEDPEMRRVVLQQSGPKMVGEWVQGTDMTALDNRGIRHPLWVEASQFADMVQES